MNINMLMQQAQRMQKDMETNIKKRRKKSLLKLKFMQKLVAVWLK